MRVLRYKFFRIETTKDDQEKKEYLGSLDVIDTGILVDGCSTTAKAFRLCDVKQKTANAIEVIEL